MLKRFDNLLKETIEAAFDCGNWSNGGEDQEPYDGCSKRLDAARATLREFISPFLTPIMSTSPSQIRWREISEKPQTTDPVTAILITRDDDGPGELFIHSICIWKGGRWIDENTGHEANCDYYVLEEDLIATMQNEKEAPR